MNKPPDLNRNKPSNIPFLKWGNSKKLNLSNNEPIYLVMRRTNSDETLSNVSPFLIKKAIDGTCGSEVLECKKTRNGTWLIKTKNNTQANNLATLIGLTNTISVEVTLHQSLNQSKGVIYCPDLNGMEENDILEELKSQKVQEVKKNTEKR